MPRKNQPGKAPAFQFYPKDWETDEHVKLMSLAQEGAFLRLVCHPCFRLVAARQSQSNRRSG